MNLSVPSSSGKTLQPRRHSVSFSPPFVFQSPLHRGRLFNSCPMPSSWLRNSSFSPLFIGEDSSTLWHIFHISTYSFLSVPSSSGKTLQRRLTRTTLEMGDPFSPLFIGEDSSTAGTTNAGALRSALSVPSSSGKTLQRFTLPAPYANSSTFFQSPLHRGRLFNLKRDEGCNRRPILSVPSSSGKTLQHGCGCIVNFSGNAFSPLFIGEGSSTTGTWLASSPYQVLSVPSSSGKALQRFWRSHCGWRSYPFSPLFIGEDSSTTQVRVTQDCVTPFSPLFIGEGSSTGSEKDPS